jgi:hypothetical protein
MECHGEGAVDENDHFRTAWLRFWVRSRHVRHRHPSRRLCNGRRVGVHGPVHPTDHR